MKRSKQYLRNDCAHDKSRHTFQGNTITPPFQTESRFLRQFATLLAGYCLFLAVPVGAQTPFGKESIISTSADGAQAVFASDLNGDGFVDVLSASNNDHTIAWYQNDGGANGLCPSWTYRRISDSAMGATVIHVEDLNGDGHQDVIAALASGDAVMWYENSGGTVPTWTPYAIDVNADGAISVYAEDFDLDGDYDVVAALFEEDKIVWYENSGGPILTWTRHVIDSNADGAISVYALDLDFDTDIDIVAASQHDVDGLTWYENDGSPQPVWTKRVISNSVSWPLSIFAMDVDGDGDSDILSAEYQSNAIAWYRNPEWTRFSISTNAIQADQVYAADIDDDGDNDVLSASFGNNKISWHENDGSTIPVWTEHILSETALGAVSVYAADVDGDGDTDILSADETDDKVAWYDNRLGAPALEDPSPGTAGMTNTFVAHNATPGSPVFFLYGLSFGSFQLGCNPVDIQDPNLFGFPVADSDGMATFTRNVPLRASGLLILIQAVDGANCAVSDLVCFRFQ